MEKAGPWTHAVVGLPIAPFPRGPLLDFDIDGPSGPASLIPRAETATREALYLEGLATQLGVTVTESVRALLVEVLGWADAETDHADLFDDPVLDSVGPAARREWLRVSADCGRMLGPYVAALGETAVTNPAVAMSALARMGFWQSESEGSAMLAGYRDLVRVATQTAFGRDDRAPIAGEFLAALGDYADTYDLMAAVRIPLDEPFVVKCSERRDLRLDSRRNTGHQDLVIADARSNHVTVTVRDPNVRISRADAFRAGDSELAVGTSVTRRNDQFVAFYSHDPNRDYRVRVDLRLALLRRLELVPFFAAGSVVLLSLALMATPDLDLRTLALLGGPAALAASVLVGREQSTLGSRLRVRSTVVLCVALAVLTVTVVYLYSFRIA
ncbi:MULTISPECIES: hypothetical protein [Nocardiaceae]|uniref:Uncharacterized protein n=1 Tax=Rhodococcoides kroppenstedtii TaxID=293050 RepID=A0ABS7NY15_9NOCA|nr:MULTISPECIES: hypothetical protein [Rhodococcus]MBY6315354.1 hypothetical protein [Rhodococcus kroppenstedtii]MBY6322934.1 hypothetical protein [Rhodococcus kroppenstedtii]MBY6401663.1 hypothetical protein [Rhodococcus kroppenstedtii]